MIIGLAELAIVLIGAVVGVVVGYLLRKRVVESKVAEAETLAGRILQEAEKGAETKLKEAELEAKERALQAKVDLERETNDRRHELQGLELRLAQKEETLDRKLEHVERRDRDLGSRDKEVVNKERAAAEREHRYGKLLEEAQRQLERISGLTAEEAKKILFHNLEHEAKLEAIALCKRLEDETRAAADQKA
ncbi:MAG: Rnase Y domain-containing protein, partial [candidate division NC10 bacterium]